MKKMSQTREKTEKEGETETEPGSLYETLVHIKRDGTERTEV